jgi:hypothetical protein
MLVASPFHSWQPMAVCISFVKVLWGIFYIEAALNPEKWRKGYTLFKFFNLRPVTLTLQQPSLG